MTLGTTRTREDIFLGVRSRVGVRGEGGARAMRRDEGRGGSMTMGTDD